MPDEEAISYRVSRKVWGEAVAASEYHAERARDLLQEAGQAENDENTRTYHIADRLLVAARIHAELSTAAATRAQAALL